MYRHGRYGGHLFSVIKRRIGLPEDVSLLKGRYSNVLAPRTFPILPILWFRRFPIYR